MLTIYAPKNIIAITASGLITVLLASSMIAQEEYKVTPIPPTMDSASLDSIDQSTPAGERKYTNAVKKLNSRLKRYQIAAVDALRGAKDIRKDPKNFDSWFERVEIPKLTKSDVASLRSLPERRQVFINNYILKPSNSRSGDPVARQFAYERLVEKILYTQLKKIVTDNDKPSYAPAVKINALLMLGDLDLALARLPSTPPVVLPAGTKFLLEVLKSTKLPAYLKPVAMVGLERHALLDSQSKNQRIAEKTRKTLLGFCYKIITDTTEENDLDYWMKRESVKILGYYGKPGSSNQVTKKLLAFIEDRNLKISLRYEAAAAYGKMEFKDAPSANALNYASALGKLALTVIRNEARFLNSERERLLLIKVRQVATTAEPSRLDESSKKEIVKKEEYDDFKDLLPPGTENIIEKNTEDKTPTSHAASEFGHDRPDVNELPEFKVHSTRIRLKTLAMYLEKATKANGIAPHLKRDEPRRKLDSLKKVIKSLKTTSDYGLKQQYVALTLEMVSKLDSIGTLLATEMGIVEEELVEEDSKVAIPGSEAGTDKKTVKPIDRPEGTPIPIPDPFAG